MSSALNSLFVRCCACSPGEKQHYSFIRSNEAKPRRSRKSQLNCSKEFIIATDYEIFPIRFIGVCISTAVQMCVLYHYANS